MADKLPTHRIKATGERVFPGGYDSAAIELIPVSAVDPDQLLKKRATAANQIDTKWPLWKQLNVLMSADTAAIAAMAADIGATRTASNSTGIAP
jgi:hypothetical protein